MTSAQAFIISLGRDEKIHYNYRNPFLDRVQTTPRVNQIDRMCAVIDNAIAPKLERGETYFQVVIQQDSTLWNNANLIKRKFKAKGIYLAWRLYRGNIVLYIQVNR